MTGFEFSLRIINPDQSNFFTYANLSPFAPVLSGILVAAVGFTATILTIRQTKRNADRDFLQKQLDRIQAISAKVYYLTEPAAYERTLLPDIRRSTSELIFALQSVPSSTASILTHLHALPLEKPSDWEDWRQNLLTEISVILHSDGR